MTGNETTQGGVLQAAGTAAASFRCAACGAIAAEVRLIRAGTPFDFGPPFGDQTDQQDGVTVSGFLGTGWKAIRQAGQDQVSEALATDPPDLAALHAVDWELAPFWCRGCRTCYCRYCWNALVLFDEGFYDCTDGICPAGHRQMLDD
ncbi:MAG TPA: hypothetical protein VK162_10235 [Streptosporangiaceae bacterium]|nr:hypothetical protein [Streptosporangiaceae bacterium]